MNALLIFFLAATASADMTCAQVSANTSEIQRVAVTEHYDSGVNGNAVLGRGGAEQMLHAEANDLAFYFSLHAQAVNGTAGPTLTPWLELRPIGDVLPRVFSGTTDPAQEPAGKGKNACTWSLGGAAAFGPLLFSTAA